MNITEINETLVRQGASVAVPALIKSTLEELREMMLRVIETQTFA
jgi:hypothetical protein